MNPSKLIVIVDNLGRTIVGRLRNEDTSKTVDIENPAVFTVEFSGQQQNQKLAARLYPFFFFDYLESPDSNYTVQFNSNLVSISDIKLNTQVVEHYINVYENRNFRKDTQTETKSEDTSGKVIQLKLEE